MLTWDESLARRLSAWRAQGLQRQLKTVTGRGVRVTLSPSAPREVVSFSSNDYLGLSAHPQVLAAARAALETAPAGAGASPLISGHRPEHQALETALAAFKGSAGALVFSSGYQAALATVAALAGPDDTVILDRLAHASLLDGARLSGARVRVFRHNALEDLARLLAREQGRLCLVVVESLYSMDGDLGPLPELLRLTADSGALLLVDEAHATGVLGEHGRGALEAAQTTGRGDAETRGRGEGQTAGMGLMPGHVMALGTLSKALGSQGGFVCARRPVLDLILHAGRAYMFSTALAPAAAAAARAALGLIDSEPQRRTHLAQLSEYVRGRLTKLGLATPSTLGPIIPVLAGAEDTASQWSAALLDRGFYVPAVRYPTVRRGQARLRLSLSAGHSPADCAGLCDALAECAR